MANLRAALLLRGDGDLLCVARRLHLVTLRDRPFVVAGPGHRGEGGVAARHRADDGMLYVDGRALPRDVEPMIAGLRAPNARARLVAGATTSWAAARLTEMIPCIATVWIPPIAEREHELGWLLEAYALDAAADLGAVGPALHPRDLEWLREGGGLDSLAVIEDVTRRLVALRNWGVAGGARRLGITHSALSRWARRRRIPT